jgi:hypothetical protein
MGPGCCGTAARQAQIMSQHLVAHFMLHRVKMLHHGRRCAKLNWPVMAPAAIQLQFAMVLPTMPHGPSVTEVRALLTSTPTTQLVSVNACSCKTRPQNHGAIADILV